MKSRPPFGARSRSFLDLLAAISLAAILIFIVNAVRPLSAAHSPRLLISEVYPAIVPSDSSIESTEWIEIHNPEPHAVDLSGWTIEDSQAISLLPEFVLPAGATVVIVGRSANVAVPPGKALIILSNRHIGNGLRNTGDRVALVDPYGVRSDAMSWGDVRIPRHSEPPEPGQSITRTPGGGQYLSDRPTPWSIDGTVDASSKRYTHPLPDTKVRIISARLDQTEDQPESVTIRNISHESLLTVNWRLTVGSSSVRVRSVRINPGETFTIFEPDGRLGSGLNRRGGYFVLRDANGNWLSTASWGQDVTFHRLTPPAEGEELSFNPLARVHPRVPWHRRFDSANHLIVGHQGPRHTLQADAVSHSKTREQSLALTAQQSEREIVWISEVHPAPGQGRNDAAYEWFEITNSSDIAVNLSGWTVADNRSSDLLEELVIPPRSSVVVGVSQEAGPEILPIIRDGRIGNGLANAGDRLTLINPAGEVMSAISWGNDRTHANVRAPKSEESIHRSSPTAEPTISAPSAGHIEISAAPDSSTVGGRQASGSEVQSSAEASQTTPARSAPSPLAQVKLPSLRITELLPAPLPGEAEWVEIFNPTDEPVDLSGWTIGDQARRTPLIGVIPPRSYLLIANLDLRSPTPALIVDRIGNGLNNDADTISLHDPDGEARSTISYGTRDVPTPGPGLSIALDPERWVVTAVASPGSEEVTPLLDDAFRSPSVQPAAPEGERLPIVSEPPKQGLNAWMIVSFALIGVILTLILRRWQPEPLPSQDAVSGAQYSGPLPATSEEHEREPNGENQRE